MPRNEKRFKVCPECGENLPLHFRLKGPEDSKNPKELECDKCSACFIVIGHGADRKLQCVKAGNLRFLAEAWARKNPHT